MTQLIDCYWLVNSRDSKKVLEFLDAFVPKRKESAVDYPFPQYSDMPTSTFKSAEQVIVLMELNEDHPYSLYWKNADNLSQLKDGMVFFTDDRKMILGLSIAGTKPDDPSIKDYYFKVKKLFNSEFGCITVEEPPPSNSLEFIDFCKARYLPKN